MKLLKFIGLYIGLLLLGGGIIYIPFNLVTGIPNIYNWENFYKIFWLILILLYQVYLLSTLHNYLYGHDEPVSNVPEKDIMLKS